MASICMYADETGNLDYNPQGKERSTQYFGFGTAVLEEDHGSYLFDALRLRAQLSARGLHLPNGFYAVDDATATRAEVFRLIRRQSPRFDMTFLYKPHAYDYVRAKGEMHLYKLAWFLHIKQIALRVPHPGDDLHHRGDAW